MVSPRTEWLAELNDIVAQKHKRGGTKNTKNWASQDPRWTITQVAAYST